jgi:hypothetical protein
MNIKEQQEIANSVMSRLKIVDPYSLLAGGAPRDWYFGNPANDLDFYFVSTGITINAVRGQLSKLFGTVGLLMDGNPDGAGRSELYKTMPFLKRIWEFTYQGMAVQLIELSENLKQFKVVDHMDISICQCWWDGVQVVKHSNFKITEASNVMFTTKEGYSWSDKHALKIKSRFKGYSAGTKEQAVQRIIGQLQ